MKMFKKLMAVVLTGVMAVSMLTGCSLSEAVMANALEKALNSKEVQSTQTIKYDHDKDLDSKAAKVYTQVIKEKKNLKATTKLTYDAKLDNGAKKYAYYIVDTGVDAKGDLKKNDKWSASALNNAIQANTLTKTHMSTSSISVAKAGYVVKGSDKTADAAKVKFGVKIYDNGAEKKADKKYYAIVVVELVENK